MSPTPPPRNVTRRAYGEDLAFVHDMGFGTVAQHAAATLLKRCTPAKGGAMIVEVGCGSGSGARLLTQAGHDVLGIDPSPAMLVLARRNAPRATFRQGSFASARLPRCHAITAIGEVLNYATETRSGWPEVVRFFERAHSALYPGGILLFDVAGPGRVPKPGRKQMVRTGTDWVVISENEEDAAHQRLTRRITTFRRDGHLYRRHDETHHLWLYQPAEVTQALRAAGFQVQILRRYGDFQFPAGLTGFVARKRLRSRGDALNSAAGAAGRSRRD